MIVADLNDLLEHLIEHNGSDLHVKVGSVPHLRIRGRLRRTPFDPSTMDELAEMVADLVPTARTRQLAERGEVSIAHGVPGLGRFRLNVYRQRGSYGLSVRLVSPGAPTIESLELPAVATALCEQDSGLVLVSGPASSGKTTTAAAMLDHINRTRTVHIVTLEDPIEVLLADKSSIVSQREIGVDARGASEALRGIGHLDPDVVFVSGLNDADTINEALSVAGAGRLVLATTPTMSVAGTVSHLVGHFDVASQLRVRYALAAVLKGVVSQRLVEGADGRGLIPAVEALTSTAAVTNAIVGGASADEFTTLMATGTAQGMQTLDQALLALVRHGRVTAEVATAASNDPDRLEVMLAEVSDPSGDEISS